MNWIKTSDKQPELDEFIIGLYLFESEDKPVFLQSLLTGITTGQKSIYKPLFMSSNGKEYSTGSFSIPPPDYWIKFEDFSFKSMKEENVSLNIYSNFQNLDLI